MIVAVGGLAISGFGGDAKRGADVLKRENCLTCHSLHGEGGQTGPDLGRRTAQGYTPAVLASVMWNHAPAMWSQMATRNLPLPKLSSADADDVFAYLYSARFFDKPGDAGRGKQVFESNGCAGCHSLTSPSKGPGTAVETWTTLSDPLILVQNMWNHASSMRNALAARKHAWFHLTGQDLTDVTVYLQNQPSLRNVAATLVLPNPEEGKAAFESKCTQCHKGSLALENRLSNSTLTDVAAAMWNHVPRMLRAPMIEPGEMGKIVSYVWQKQYLGPGGNAGQGRKVFEEKRCATCHNDPAASAPKIVRGERVFTPLVMVSVLWSHGPAMQAQMKQKNIPWPRLTPGDLSNLVAYINTKP